MASAQSVPHGADQADQAVVNTTMSIGPSSMPPNTSASQAMPAVNQLQISRSLHHNDAAARSARIVVPFEMQMAVAQELGVGEYFRWREFFRYTNDGYAPLGQLGKILSSHAVAHEMFKLDSTHGSDSVRPRPSQDFEGNMVELMSRERVVLQHQDGTPQYFLREIKDDEKERGAQRMLHGDFYVCCTKHGDCFGDSLHHLKLYDLARAKCWSLKILSVVSVCLTDKLLAVTCKDKLYSIRNDLHTIRLNNLTPDSTLDLAQFDVKALENVTVSTPIAGIDHRIAMLAIPDDNPQAKDVLIYNEESKTLITIKDCSFIYCDHPMFAVSCLWIFDVQRLARRPPKSQGITIGIRIIQVSWSGEVEDLWIIQDSADDWLADQDVSHHMVPFDTAYVSATGLADVCSYSYNMIIDLKNKKMVRGPKGKRLSLWKDRAYVCIDNMEGFDAFEKLKTCNLNMHCSTDVVEKLKQPYSRTLEMKLDSIPRKRLLTLVNSAHSSQHKVSDSLLEDLCQSSFSQQTELLSKAFDEHTERLYKAFDVHTDDYDLEFHLQSDAVMINDSFMIIPAWLTYLVHQEWIDYIYTFDESRFIVKGDQSGGVW